MFGNENVKKEWDVAKNSEDRYTRELYCPRVDFAVGPFNTNPNIVDNNKQIENSYQRYKRLLDRLKSRSDIKDRTLETNENPRCFIVIEVENKTSRKHRLGSLLNASALGKIGIIVASNEKVFDSFDRIRKYLEFLMQVHKTRYVPENVIIITKENFLKILKTENPEKFERK